MSTPLSQQLYKRAHFIALTSLLLLFLPPALNAQSHGGYACKMLESCALIPTGTTVMRHCNVTTHCTFVPNMNPPPVQPHPLDASRNQLMAAHDARYNSKEERLRRCEGDALSNLSSCQNSAENQYKSNQGTCHWLTAGGAASAIAGAVLSVPTFGWGAAVGFSGAATFGAAATICYNNAQGARGEAMRKCDINYQSQLINSCGRIQ